MRRAPVSPTASGCASRPRPPAGARPGDRRGQLGRLGEDWAEAHLRGLGFSTLARNERCRAGEINLIVFDGRTLVFAEANGDYRRWARAPAVPAL